MMCSMNNTRSVMGGKKDFFLTALFFVSDFEDVLEEALTCRTLTTYECDTRRVYYSTRQVYSAVLRFILNSMSEFVHVKHLSC